MASDNDTIVNLIKGYELSLSKVNSNSRTSDQESILSANDQQTHTRNQISVQNDTENNSRGNKYPKMNASDMNNWDERSRESSADSIDIFDFGNKLANEMCSRVQTAIDNLTKTNITPSNTSMNTNHGASCLTGPNPCSTAGIPFTLSSSININMNMIGNININGSNRDCIVITDDNENENECKDELNHEINNAIVNEMDDEIASEMDNEISDAMIIGREKIIPKWRDKNEKKQEIEKEKGKEKTRGNKQNEDRTKELIDLSIDTSDTDDDKNDQTTINTIAMQHRNNNNESLTKKRCQISGQQTPPLKRRRMLICNSNNSNENINVYNSHSHATVSSPSCNTIGCQDMLHNSNTAKPKIATNKRNYEIVNKNKYDCIYNLPTAMSIESTTRMNPQCQEKAATCASQTFGLTCLMTQSFVDCYFSSGRERFKRKLEIENIAKNISIASITDIDHEIENQTAEQQQQQQHTNQNTNTSNHTYEIRPMMQVFDNGNVELRGLLRWQMQTDNANLCHCHKPVIIKLDCNNINNIIICKENPYLFSFSNLTKMKEYQYWLQFYNNKVESVKMQSMNNGKNINMYIGNNFETFEKYCHDGINNKEILQQYCVVWINNGQIGLILERKCYISLISRFNSCTELNKRIKLINIETKRNMIFSSRLFITLQELAIQGSVDTNHIQLKLKRARNECLNFGTKNISKIVKNCHIYEGNNFDGRQLAFQFVFDQERMNLRYTEDLCSLLSYDLQESLFDYFKTLIARWKQQCKENIQANEEAQQMQMKQRAFQTKVKTDKEQQKEKEKELEKEKNDVDVSWRKEVETTEVKVNTIIEMKNLDSDDTGYCERNDTSNESGHVYSFVVIDDCDSDSVSMSDNELMFNHESAEQKKEKEKEKEKDEEHKKEKVKEKRDIDSDKDAKIDCAKLDKIDNQKDEIDQVMEKVGKIEKIEKIEAKDIVMQAQNNDDIEIEDDDVYDALLEKCKQIPMGVLTQTEVNLRNIQQSGSPFACPFNLGLEFHQWKQFRDHWCQFHKTDYFQARKHIQAAK